MDDLWATAARRIVVRGPALHEPPTDRSLLLARVLLVVLGIANLVMEVWALVTRSWSTVIAGFDSAVEQRGHPELTQLSFVAVALILVSSLIAVGLWTVVPLVVCRRIARTPFWRWGSFIYCTCFVLLSLANPWRMALVLLPVAVAVLIWVRPRSFHSPASDRSSN
jgi:hypothetical protein